MGTPLTTPEVSLTPPHCNTQSQTGDVLGVEGGGRIYSGFHGSLSGAPATSTALPLGSGAFPHPDFPLPTQIHTLATATIPPIPPRTLPRPQARDVEFCLQSNLSG